MRNETRGAVFKKQQFITVCYSTCVRIEMKQEGQFSKTKQKTPIYCSMLFNLYAYWIETRFIQNSPINDNMQNLCAKWNKRGSFQKTTIYYSMLFNLCAYWNKRDNKRYAIQHRGIFQKTTIYYCMIFNLCAYWNETRGAVFKKKPTQIYYSMLFNLCAYWNETRGVVFKKIQLMTICYWTHVRNETRGAVFKKQQFITVCYSTCVRIEMKQERQFSKKSN